MLQPRSFLFTKSRDSSHERLLAEKRYRSPAWSEIISRRESMADNSPGARPTSSPLQIPVRQEGQSTRKRAQDQKERSGGSSERRARNIHSPDALPPSVAALLAITSIPPPKSSRHGRRSGASQRLTVDAILQHTGMSEKEYGTSLSKSPLDLLLNTADDDDDDNITESDNGQESIMSGRTLSSESMPSLDDESLHESPSLSSLVTPGSVSPRGKRSKRLPPYPSPKACSPDDHPLFAPQIDVEELDFRVFQKVHDAQSRRSESKPEPARQKSAFKSNLTASLRALRSAARSISTITTPLITPDDFLTRSIISIDPQVPFTDERMPPRLEDTPTPALRRYLNPTTNAPIAAHIPSSQSQSLKIPECTASIQMQTYKISRSTKAKAPSVISRRTQSRPNEGLTDPAAGPLARQRDMRENSDFIRVAVMEMLMRKRGKLDDQKPGRARWALPPRTPPTKPYEIAANGVPVRWIAMTD